MTDPDIRSTRQMLEDAYALDDEVKRDLEQWQHSQLKKKHGDAGLVYKTHVPQPMPQQQSTPAMDEKTSAAWNKWMTDYVHAYVNTRLEGYTEAAVEGIAEALADLRAELRKEFSEQLADLRAHKAAKSDVVPLVRKGERDVA
jgi:hypothetical protein